MAFVLDGLFHAQIRDVIIVALTAERIPAALETTVRTNRGTTIGTLRDGGLAAGHPVVAITRRVFDLARAKWVWESQGHATLQNNRVR
jgi:hypothetical protein